MINSNKKGVRGNFLFFLIAIIVFSLLSIYYVNKSFTQKSDEILALKESSTSLRGNDAKLLKELEFLKAKLNLLEKQNEKEISTIKNSHLNSIEEIEERNKNEKQIIIDKLDSINKEKKKIQEDINLENQKLKNELNSLKEINQKIIEEITKEDKNEINHNQLPQVNEDKPVVNHNQLPQVSEDKPVVNHNQLPQISEDKPVVNNNKPPNVNDFRKGSLNQEELNKYTGSNKKKSSLFDSLNKDSISDTSLNKYKKYNDHQEISNQNMNSNQYDSNVTKDKISLSSYNLPISKLDNIKKKTESFFMHNDYIKGQSLCDQSSHIIDLSKKRPVEFYQPPSDASNEDKIKWQILVSAMKNKISSLNQGGDSLRNSIKFEIQKLENERLKLFCQYE